MAKAKRNIGQEILDGLRELKSGEYGRVINVPDVASIRTKTGLSQARFAVLLGVSVRTLQDWEQGRFIRFHGLAQWIGWLWPYGAIVWLLARLAQRGRD